MSRRCVGESKTYYVNPMIQGARTGGENGFVGSIQPKMTTASMKSCVRSRLSQHVVLMIVILRNRAYTDELVQEDVAQVDPRRSVEPEYATRALCREHDGVIELLGLQLLNRELVCARACSIQSRADTTRSAGASHLNEVVILNVDQ